MYHQILELTKHPPLKTALSPRDSTQITAFSISIESQLGQDGCGFTISLNSGLDDSVSTDCSALSDGSTIGSLSGENVEYSISCNENAVMANGETECANLRHVCIILPLVGKGCATVDIGAFRGVGCSKKLKGRQDAPSTCGTAKGTNLPQVLLF